MEWGSLKVIGRCEEYRKIGLSRIVMSKGVPLGGERSSSVMSSDEANVESVMSKEG